MLLIKTKNNLLKYRISKNRHILVVNALHINMQLRSYNHTSKKHFVTYCIKEEHCR